MYEYRATIDRVIDGDTVDAVVDLGFSTYTKMRLRLTGIDAPEKRRPTLDEGKEAEFHLEDLILDNGPRFIIKTLKDKADSFGRYMAEIITEDGVSINRQMIEDGHAVEYERE